MGVTYSIACYDCKVEADLDKAGRDFCSNRMHPLLPRYMQVVLPEPPGAGAEKTGGSNPSEKYVRDFLARHERHLVFIYSPDGDSLYGYVPEGKTLPVPFLATRHTPQEWLDALSSPEKGTRLTAIEVVGYLALSEAVPLLYLFA